MWIMSALMNGPIRCVCARSQDGSRARTLLYTGKWQLREIGDGAHLCLLRANLLSLFPHLPAFFLPLFSEDHGSK